MKIGNLYLVKGYCWLLFPSKETAAITIAAEIVAAAHAVAVAATAVYYSRRLNCEVNYFSPDSYVVFFEEDGPLKRVLTADGKIGWTFLIDDYNDCFEEVNAE